eukprot:CFRG4346T1
MMKSFGIDLEAYLWARAVLWSRMAEMTKPDGQRVEILAPWFDLFNHSPQVPPGKAFKIEDSNVVVRATKDYKMGDQAFISYGDLPNGVLLLTHGFAIKNNPANSLPFYLTVSDVDENRLAGLMLCAPEVTAPAQDPRLAAFEYISLPEEGNDFCAKHLLTPEIPLPSALVRMVKIERMSGTQLSTIIDTEGQRGLLEILETDKPIVEGNDITAYIALHKTFTDMIVSATLMDTAATSASTTTSTSKRRMENALVVRESERDILRLAVAECEKGLYIAWGTGLRRLETESDRCGCEECMAKGSPYWHTLRAAQARIESNQEQTIKMLRSLMCESVSDLLHIQTVSLIFMFVHELWSHVNAQSVIILDEACPEGVVSSTTENKLRFEDLDMRDCPEASIYKEKLRLWSSYLYAQLCTSDAVSLHDMNTMRMETFNLRSQGLIIPTELALTSICKLLDNNDDCAGVVAVGSSRCHVWVSQLRERSVPVVNVETLNELTEYPNHALLLVSPDDGGKGLAGWSIMNKNPNRKLMLLVGEWADSTFGAYAKGMPTTGQSFSKQAQEAVTKRYVMKESVPLPPWPLYVDRLALWARGYVVNIIQKDEDLRVRIQMHLSLMSITVATYGQMTVKRLSWVKSQNMTMQL